MTDLFAVIESAEVTEAQWNSLAATGTPASIARTPARISAPACNVLALDLATRCGWAYAMRDGKQRSGTELFKPGRLDHNGQRWAQKAAE